MDRLVELSASFPLVRVPLSEIRELDEHCSDSDDPLTWRSLVAHVILMDEAELSYPIILSADGRVMDGRHRVAKALRAGMTHIDAVRFVEDPPPDHVGRSPDELPYDNDT